MFHLIFDVTFAPAHPAEYPTILVFKTPMQGGSFADFLQAKPSLAILHRQTIDHCILKAGAGEVCIEFDDQIRPVVDGVTPT